MSSVDSLDRAGRLFLTRRDPSVADTEAHFPIDSLLLPGDSREDLNHLLKSFLQQYRPVSLLENELVFQMVEARWNLARLDRLEAAGGRREQLIWSWHQSLTQLRRLRKNPPRRPLPPAASRFDLISHHVEDDPIAPDRRGPRQPTLPTALPKAA